jgi:lipoate-protein ligase A
MAVDQAISESVSRSVEAGNAAAPTLRFYTWENPTLSLGYFQRSAEASPRFDRLARVRRATGGGAILHHNELTYSLTLPSAAGQRGARPDLYRGVHAAIIARLDRNLIAARPHRLDKRRSAGEPFLCFQRRSDEDLVVNGYKILGSAQRRTKRSILQHGSLLLRSSEHASELPGIYELTSQALDPETLALQIAEEIGQSVGIAFLNGDLTSAERDRAEQIRKERFESPRWWSRR